ncbi:MAG: hypothetical protein E2O58_02190 [Gammaproteobacteria bacterium]|nr:MAG: hypothetical protein E2O58_02190 [Gammaproteobacteria bacterium]
MPGSRTNLGSVDRSVLAQARVQAHSAAQWASKIGRANLPALADDSHSNLGWDAGLQALLGQPLTETSPSIQFGVQLQELQLIVVTELGTETLSLAGTSEVDAGSWVDDKARALGLRPASEAEMPYALDPLDRYASVPAQALAELAEWFDLAAELLTGVADSLVDVSPGASPVRCWPHHFDIATLIRLEPGDPETARSLGVGLSPGDGAYGEPYFYVTPWPPLEGAASLDLGGVGHWHTEGFSAGVLTRTELGDADEVGRVAGEFLSSVVTLTTSFLRGKTR